jgi:hypothetical protein
VYLREPVGVHGLQVGQDLAREGFVVLERVNVGLNEWFKM